MESLRLEPACGGEIEAHLTIPSGTPLGGIVVIQEIFGANAHIRAVAQRFADAGFAAIAPALFDFVKTGVELPYTDEGMSEGRALAAETGFDRAVSAVGAAYGALEARGITSIGAVGFCWGGSVAFLANALLGLPAVSYYGARTVPFLDEPLRAPMQFHFGGQDPLIPLVDIEKTRAAIPDAEMYVYPEAGHAFNRDVDPNHYNAEAAELAWQRTLAFFKAHLS